MIPSELNKISRSAAATGPLRIEDALTAPAERGGADQDGEAEIAAHVRPPPQ
jgi:hypothetical protein